MSYQDVSPFSMMYDRQDDDDFDDDNEEYLEEDRDGDEQDESDEGMYNIKTIKIKRFFYLFLFLCVQFPLS